MSACKAVCEVLRRAPAMPLSLGETLPLGFFFLSPSVEPFSKRVASLRVVGFAW